MTTTVAGLIAIAAPLLIGGFILLRRSIPVLLFFYVLSAVAVGYLYSTGAVDDVGAVALGAAGAAGEPVGEPTPAPAN